MAESSIIYYFLQSYDSGSHSADLGWAPVIPAGVTCALGFGRRVAGTWLVQNSLD